MLIREIRFQFEDAPAFLDEYERSLSSGWIFVPSEDDFELGEALEITLELGFCSRSVRVLGVVTSRIDPALARMLAREPGAIIEFADGMLALQEMIHDTVASLAESSWQRPGSPGEDGAARRLTVSKAGAGARSPARVESRAGERSAAVIEVSGVDFKVGEKISLQLVDPRTGERVALSANVVRVVDADAHVPQARLDAEDAGEARRRRAQFFERARAIHDEHRRGGISGNLSGLSLPSLLQSIATSSARGTMNIASRGGEARLLFESNRLRYAAVGKVEGIKALARLLEWPEGEFSFQPVIDDDEPDRPLISMDSALMEATHQADELRRLQGSLLPDTIVVERTELAMALALEETEAAVLGQLTQPTCPTALVDSLPVPDAEVWRALLRLVERGFVAIREEPARA